MFTCRSLSCPCCVWFIFCSACSLLSLSSLLLSLVVIPGRGSTVLKDTEARTSRSTLAHFASISKYTHASFTRGSWGNGNRQTSREVQHLTHKVWYDIEARAKDCNPGLQSSCIKYLPSPSDPALVLPKNYRRTLGRQTGTWRTKHVFGDA